ncbi:MAG: hypothetical protein IPM46_02090 [Flavobacteriales bacterium]|nr:hypothetical protein [Flavobacteriales bacterium]
MRASLPTLAALSAIILLGSCLKDTEELAQDTGLLPSSCGSTGARLQATVGGSSYCANGQLIATGDGSSVLITGISLAGTTLIVQVDSLGTGIQAITEASNGLLYMENGNTYVVQPSEPGVLTITEADTTARILKASFSANLRNEMSGISRSVQGELDVVWSDGE